MGSIPIPPWANYHMAQQSNAFESASGSPPIRGSVELSTAITKRPLSVKSVEDVCSVVRMIDGISKGISKR